jgi:hypothetical protein
MAWIVTVDGIPYRFTQRCRARGFAMIRRAAGHSVTVHPEFD